MAGSPGSASNSAAVPHMGTIRRTPCQTMRGSTKTMRGRPKMERSMWESDSDNDEPSDKSKIPITSSAVQNTGSFRRTLTQTTRGATPGLPKIEKSMWESDSEEEEPVAMPGLHAKSVSNHYKIEKCIWDPDDDEFADLPTTFRSTYGTFKRQGLAYEEATSTRSFNSDCSDPDDIDDIDPRELGPSHHDLSLQTAERDHDTIAELGDPACGSSSGPDLHDQLMAKHFIKGHPDLPPESPALRMHIINWRAYGKAKSNQDDQISQLVRPRLCDAVATILFETSPQCLDDFLNAGTFEWCHSFKAGYKNSCVVVRRDGNRIVCGVFRNIGFHYLWSCIVKSHISYSGKWTDVFSDGQGTTPITKVGPEWDSFTKLDGPSGQDSQSPTDASYVLHAGRKLASCLVSDKELVWKSMGREGEALQWEADGRVNIVAARVRERGSDDSDED